MLTFNFGTLYTPTLVAFDCSQQCTWTLNPDISMQVTLAGSNPTSFKPAKS